MSVVAGLTQNSGKILYTLQSYQTDTDTCKFEYEWTIKQFSRCSKQKIISPIFSSHYSDFEDEWNLEVNANSNIYSDTEPGSDNSDSHHSDTDDKYVSVELHLQSYNNNGTKQLNTECQISINNRDARKGGDYTFETPRGYILHDKFILRSELLKPSNGYLHNDELKICCSIKMTKKLTNNFFVVPTNTQQLSVDWEKLLLSKKSADVTIQVGQKSFCAIKGILAARSPVFSAMFDHKQFKENQKNQVVIEDVDENVFDEFLHYIYTGDSANIDKMPMELLDVAEKYQVNCLKDICEDVISKTIYFDNVGSLIVCSDRYNLKKLNEKCLEFMKKNLQDVMSDETFQIYKKKYPEIFVGILEHLLLS